MVRREKGEGCFYFREKQNLWSYIASFPEGRKSFYGKTKKDCLDKYNKYVKDREYFGISADSNTSLSSYYEHFLLVNKDLLAVTTKKMYRDIKKTMTKPSYKLFDMSLRQINITSIKKYFESTQHILAYTTVKRIKSILSQVFELAVAEGIYEKNPVRMTSLRNLAFKETRDRSFFTEDEIKSFTKHIDYNEPNELMLLFIIHTGLRLGELLGLRWNDIRGNYIYITNNRVRSEYGYVDKKPKSKSGVRMIPLSDTAKNIIEFFKNMEQRNECYVFAQRNGSLAESEVLRYHLRKICNEANLPMLSIHELRHTFGSTLVGKGVDIKIISSLMGHSDTSITYSIYVHFSESQMCNAISTLNCL